MNDSKVDSFRFTGRFIKQVISDAIEKTTPATNIPWTPPSKALAESRVALLTTAGVSMKGEPPFDMQTERDKGDWGDPSWRAISADATSDDVVVNHLHIDTSYIEQDLNVALPLTRLHELAAAGIVGDVAPTHYSIMGFQGADPSHLENLSAPEIALSMKKDAVDLALLAPV